MRIHGTNQTTRFSASNASKKPKEPVSLLGMSSAEIHHYLHEQRAKREQELTALANNPNAVLLGLTSLERNTIHCKRMQVEAQQLSQQIEALSRKPDKTAEDLLQLRALQARQLSCLPSGLASSIFTQNAMRF